MGKPMREAILDGAQQIALPAFVSMFFLTGVSRYLYVPLAEAVVFAMLASYFWSRTLVPTMALYLLPHEFSHENTQENSKEFKKSRGFAYTVSPLVKIQERFNRGFEHFKSSYSNILLSALHHPKKFGISFLAVCLLSSLLFLVVGENFFPDIDAGEIRMHLRAKTGTRIEETARSE